MPPILTAGDAPRRDAIFAMQLLVVVSVVYPGKAKNSTDKLRRAVLMLDALLGAIEGNTTTAPTVPEIRVESRYRALARYIGDAQNLARLVSSGFTSIVLSDFNAYRYAPRGLHLRT